MPIVQEAGLSRNQLVRELAKSTHGSLDSYNGTISTAAVEDPEFLAHLIAWNHKNGQVRDSKVALPVVSIATPEFDDPELLGNSLAHLCLLDPRNFLKGMRHALSFELHGRGNQLKRLVKDYLRARESRLPWWERSVLAHRKSVKELYALFHVKPSSYAQKVLFERYRAPGSLLEAVAQLPHMSPKEAAGTILEKKVPFLAARGALGKRIEEPVLLMALIERMSPTELVTNAKMLERCGVKNSAATRVAFQKKLTEAASSKRATLKTSKATKAVSDKALKAKLDVAQEKQLDNIAVKGNWLVLGDRSPSMAGAVSAAAEVATVLARVAEGNVYLVFFDGSVHKAIVATGMTHEQITKHTKHIRDGGSGTSIGAGVWYALQHNWDVDGIAIVSDGEENTAPRFTDAYQKYCSKLGKEPTVYHYLIRQVRGGNPVGQRNYYFLGHYAENVLKVMCAAANIPVEEFDLSQQDFDFYSLPNLVQTMRTNRFSLADEVMQVPLLCVADALKPEAVGRV